MTNSISINQINAQVKIQEIWKAINIKGSPLNFTIPTNDPNTRCSRSSSNGRLLLSKGKTTLSQATFLNDGTRLWNLAPNEIKTCNSIFSVKGLIKSFVKTLPV